MIHTQFLAALIEDPQADLVLRSELKPGATVLVEPSETESGEQDVKLTVLQPVPAGVGGEGDGGDQPSDEERPPPEAESGE